jgi:hypothetical protein
MVLEGSMPRPKRYRGCVIWDRRALDEAFSCLPEEVGAKAKSINPWEAMSND